MTSGKVSDLDARDDATLDLETLAKRITSMHDAVLFSQEDGCAVLEAGPDAFAENHLLLAMAALQTASGHAQLAAVYVSRAAAARRGYR